MKDFKRLGLLPVLRKKEKAPESILILCYRNHSNSEINRHVKKPALLGLLMTAS